jgi:urease accessory protein
MPTTFLEGLLSGLSHPAVGLDHLAFLLVLGVGAALVPSAMPLIVTFISAASVGAVVHAVNFDFPLSEQLVALTVVVSGALIALGLGAKQFIWLPFAAIAGLLHGYAFGETILGADTSVIGAYVIGVIIVCSVIAVAVMQLASKVLNLSDPGSRPLRIGGALIASLGVVLLVQLIRNG